MWTEINLDGLVGPTHHFGGLGVGNLASLEHARRVSHPRAAALEGLGKAALVAGMGIPQFLFLPPPRPRLDFLESLGFETGTREGLEEALQNAPHEFSAAFSSAFMWAANSATVTPACDTTDRRTHLTPANLISSWHRASEAAERWSDLKSLFAACPTVQIHAPLPASVPLRDEGAANHMRLCAPVSGQAMHLFVHGGAANGLEEASPRFFARQTRAACEAIARRHRLPPQFTYHLRQHPQAISAGVFHNDVIATSHENLLLYHELAFVDADAELQRVQRDFERLTGEPLVLQRIAAEDMPLEDAVRSYFFNSQIVSPRNSDNSQRMALICPEQCREITAARNLIARLLEDSQVPIEDVHYVSLAESMANGGGPACLRLRVLLSDDDIARLPPQVRLTPRTVDTLSEVFERHYPKQLELSQLCDPATIREFQNVSVIVRTALLSHRT